MLTCLFCKQVGLLCTLSWHVPAIHVPVVLIIITSNMSGTYCLAVPCTFGCLHEVDSDSPRHTVYTVASPRSKQASSTRCHVAGWPYPALRDRPRIGINMYSSCIYSREQLIYFEESYGRWNTDISVFVARRGRRHFGKAWRHRDKPIRGRCAEKVNPGSIYIAGKRHSGITRSCASSLCRLTC